MPKVILDVPEEVAEKLRAMEAKLKATAAAAREGAAELDVDSALAAVDEAVDATVSWAALSDRSRVTLSDRGFDQNKEPACSGASRVGFAET